MLLLFPVGKCWAWLWTGKSTQFHYRLFSSKTIVRKDLSWLYILLSSASRHSLSNTTRDWSHTSVKSHWTQPFVGKTTNTMQVDSGIQEDQPGDATGRVVRCANPTPLLTNLSQTPKPLLHLFLQLRHLFRQENKFFNLMGKKKSEAECCTCSSSYPPASDVWGSLRDGKSTYSLLRSTYSLLTRVSH